MTAPPGITPTTETAAGHDRQVTATEVTLKREAIRFLRAELGITGAQANRLYGAYLRDLERPVVTAARSYRASFIDWLMRQAPGGRRQDVRKWRIGEGNWRTT